MLYNQAFFDAGINRRGTNCVKWDETSVMPSQGVPLWVADMDFRCAEEIKDGMLQRVQHPCYGYTMLTAEDSKAFCDFLHRRHNLSVKPEETEMLPCVITGLKTMVNVFSKPGDAVAILTPVYGPFTSSIEVNHRKAVRIPLKNDQNLRYQIDFAALERAFQDGVRLFLMCSPHNPVSRVWTEDELNQLLLLCRKYHVVLGVDEIHAEFVISPNHFVSILSMAEGDDSVVSFMSASKTFNIAGLQQAMIISRNPDILKAMKDFLDASGAESGNLFALEGTRAAYRHGDAWLDGLLEYLSGNIQTLQETLADALPNARLTPVEATYLAWIDLTEYDKSCASLKEKFFRNGVVLTDGTFFGPEGEGHMRLNFGCPRSQLIEGIMKMSQALRSF